MMLKPTPCSSRTWFAPPLNCVASEGDPSGPALPVVPQDTCLSPSPLPEPEISRQDLARVVYAEEPPPVPQLVRLPRDPFRPHRPTTGERAVAQARAWRGQRSASLRGRLPRFQAAGGQSNNCADFVSSLQQNAGRLKHHYVGVPELEAGLQHEGWRRIPGREARPGDVWISAGAGHTEMVTQAGGTRLIGSNNGGRPWQTISEHRQDPRQGRYYGLR